MEHVESVTPILHLYGFAQLGDRAEPAELTGVPASDDYHRRRLVAGLFFDGPRERSAVASELLLYRLGLTDDADLAKAVGQKLRFEVRGESARSGFVVFLVRPNGGEQSRAETAALDKVRARLPDLLDQMDLTDAEKQLLRQANRQPEQQPAPVFGAEFTIVGVVRLPTAEEVKGPWNPLRTDADVLLPLETATDFYFRVPSQEERGIDYAIVTVDREEHVKEVSERIKSELGIENRTLLEFIERQRLLYLLIFGAMTVVAAVALLVAALGIANTMLMSVLERTREIGVMKAVGAGSGQLVSLFLVEGGLIGLVGGGLGLLLGWAASFPGDAWVRSMVSRDLKYDLQESLFTFPPSLVLTVLGFALLVTTLAAVYPARRAAQVDPVAALRHE